MSKLLGALCILSGSIWAVMTQLRKRRQDSELLQSLIGAIHAMEVSIRWKGQTVPACMKALSSRKICGKYFANILQSLESDIALQSSWKQVFCSIPKEESDILLQMDWDGDETHVIGNLQYISQALTALYEQRQARKHGEIKLLIASVGSAAGLLIILLL